MASGEAWVMRPALAGVCLYESLVDGTLDLGDVARMNDALDVREENLRRIAERE
jgi:hypothetical protein